MPQTIQTILPFLEYVAGPVGSGMIMSLIVTWLRRRSARPTTPVSGWQHLAATVLYAPFWTRMVVLVGAGGLAIASRLVIAWLSQEPDLLSVFDAALAATTGAIASQLQHSKDLPKDYWKSPPRS